jgi:predicted CopG family antitoxin
MAKRKKRLKKGMESLLDVIAEHEEKRRKAIEDGDLLLKEY